MSDIKTDEQQPNDQQPSRVTVLLHFGDWDEWTDPLTDVSPAEDSVLIAELWEAYPRATAIRITREYSLEVY